MAILELAGAPKTGKTLLSNAIERIARREGLEVRHFHGGGRYVPLSGKGSAQFNAAVAARNTYTLLCMAQSNHFHIMDRGVVDALIFTAALKECKRISHREAKAIESFVDQEYIWRSLDRVTLLFASVDTLAERETRSTGRMRDGSINNKIIRQALIEATESMASFLRSRGVSHQLIQTDGTIEDLLAKAPLIFASVHNTKTEGDRA